jgi:hypothetical protein
MTDTVSSSTQAHFLDDRSFFPCRKVIWRHCGHRFSFYHGQAEDDTGELAFLSSSSDFLTILFHSSGSFAAGMPVELQQHIGGPASSGESDTGKLCRWAAGLAAGSFRPSCLLFGALHCVLKVYILRQYLSFFGWTKLARVLFVARTYVGTSCMYCCSISVYRMQL